MVEINGLVGSEYAQRAWWYALTTRSRHERAVQRMLAHVAALETYVPVRRVWSTRTDRRVRIQVPALPGYVFLRAALTPELRSLIKRTPGVVAFVCSGDVPARIPDEQIESLRIVLRVSDDVDVQSTFAPGQLVRVRSGLLKGAYGVLVRTNTARRRLVLQIDHIGLTLSVELHEADVEVLGVAPWTHSCASHARCVTLGTKVR